MELKHISEIEKATAPGRGELFRFGLALIFIVGVMFYSALSNAGQGGLMFVMAAMLGGYMALNIGANDVANNVGPAVGSKALSLGGALVIAAIFEAGGALIAGGEVVGTIRSGIIDPDLINDSDTFVWIMLAALLAGALWLNLATAVGAPVSTTRTTASARSRRPGTSRARWKRPAVPRGAAGASGSATSSTRGLPSMPSRCTPSAAAIGSRPMASR